MNDAFDYLLPPTEKCTKMVIEALLSLCSQDDYPLASLPLLGYSVTVPSESENIHKDYVFKLHFKSHVYYFRSESEYTFERCGTLVDQSWGWVEMYLYVLIILCIYTTATCSSFRVLLVAVSIKFNIVSAEFKFEWYV